MRRVLAVLALSVVAALPAAAAQPYFKASGAIAMGNPATKTTGGITERVNPCGRRDKTLGSQNGVDAFWLTLRDGSAGRAARMTSSAMDMDVWFYDETCDVIVRSEDAAAEGWATTNTAAEDGKVPDAAVYVAVTMAAGRSAAFTFVVS